MDLFLEILLEVVGYGTARILVPIATLGTCYVNRGVPRSNVWWKDPKGRICLSHGVGAMLGVAFWIAVLVVTVWVLA